MRQKDNKMSKITFLMSEDVPLSSFAIPLDVFMAAGNFWNKLLNTVQEPAFEIQTVTVDGNPVKSIYGPEIKPDASIDDADVTGTIIVGATVDPNTFLPDKTIPWLKSAYKNGIHIASICTGTFLLAETGLLNNKIATTHWGFIDEFRNRFPEVILKPEKLITDENDLFCSGGANAGGDLALYLVSKYSGKEVALQTARALLMDMDRSSQSSYSIFRFEKSHGDNEIVNIQDWIENHFKKEIRVDCLANKAGMSRRTFERRFKNATGDSPLKYLQRVRVESAKTQLEKGFKTFDEITYQVGYEDSSAVSRIFKKNTGLSPKLYKDKYTLLS